MNFNPQETGKRIRELRQERGKSLAATAYDMNLGEGTLRKIESGERGPSMDVLLMLSEYFNVSTDYLLKGENNNAFGQEINDVIDRLKYILRRF